MANKYMNIYSTSFTWIRETQIKNNITFYLENIDQKILSAKNRSECGKRGPSKQFRY